MKKTLLIVSILFLATFILYSSANALVHVNGYTKKNGTYVAPYVRTDPDGIESNNFSYPGNSVSIPSYSVPTPKVNGNWTTIPPIEVKTPTVESEKLKIVNQILDIKNKQSETLISQNNILKSELDKLKTEIDLKEKENSELQKNIDSSEKRFTWFFWLFLASLIISIYLGNELYLAKKNK